jgi:hypothetical protein
MQPVLQNPHVVDIARQPPVTPEITYPDVILGAVGVTVIIMVLAALAGILAGGIIIYLKKRAEARSSSSDSDHARLRISAP